MSSEENIVVKEVEKVEIQQLSAGTKRTETQWSSNHTLSSKRRKECDEISDIWKHFTLKKDDSREEDDSQESLSGDSSSGNLMDINYEPEVFRRSVNEMIVMHGLPFSFVESEGFKRFCSKVVPFYKLESPKTVASDIAEMYLQEKASLKKLFKEDDKIRVSLTTDIWVAPTTSCSYMAITAYWIDANWCFQKKIISFKPVTDHKEDTIVGQLIECLEEWGIKRVFTVTVDDAEGNDKALRLFKESLKQRGNDALVLDGDFMHMRCCAHIVNVMARDSLAHVNDSVVAIRNAVKYVQSSFTRLKSFELHVENGKDSRGSLPLDCDTQWNTTYLMLTAALKSRTAFEKMLGEDKLYGDYFLEVEENGEKLVGPPTSGDWDNVQRLVKFLQIFFNCNLAFSASKAVTSTNCYNVISTIEMNLMKLSNSSDEELRNQATSMRDKFWKYWDGLLNMNELVIVSSVFDPRNKMRFASFCFERLYGIDSVESSHLRESVSNVMHKLYEGYSVRLKKPSQSESNHGDLKQSSDMLDDYDWYESIESLYEKLVVSERGYATTSSELEIYLMEKVENQGENGLGLDNDVLSWWKRNSSRYPILSEVARDVLAIQMSSIASEFVFSTSGRILDPFRSSLTPYMTEALICTQQWLLDSYDSDAQAPNLEQMMEESDFFESLDTRK